LAFYQGSFQTLTKKPGSKLKTAAKWGLPPAAIAGVGAWVVLGR